MANKTIYIVKFFNFGSPYYLADWHGDPGRTVVRDNAKKFKTLQVAKNAKNKAISDNPQRYLRNEVYQDKNIAVIEEF